MNCVTLRRGSKFNVMGDIRWVAGQNIKKKHRNAIRWARHTASLISSRLYSLHLQPLRRARWSEVCDKLEKKGKEWKEMNGKKREEKDRKEKYREKKRGGKYKFAKKGAGRFSFRLLCTPRNAWGCFPASTFAIIRHTLKHQYIAEARAVYVSNFRNTAPLQSKRGSV